ncbi:hypothetical protein EG68_11254 [Paragonimus skrjabini miyazakii]|uniref:BLOC-1-related complex subunit 6 C-terminal helix domain-containing protein n=1 Tax=Paragonimus skrjabini miyazakii TaxID=59628 RepID=A0A8S9YID9_9TREM|nr:hypothetical protein EG68_11254 [Paragonimus skrjabini miyazakii]
MDVKGTADDQNSMRSSDQGPSASLQSALITEETERDQQLCKPLATEGVMNSSLVLSDLESRARDLATQLDKLMISVHCGLHRISSLTLECVSVLADSVDVTCEAVDSSIKSTYSLMAKCEELSKSMALLSPLEKEIGAVKCTLDKFESAVRSSVNK